MDSQRNIPPRRSCPPPSLHQCLLPSHSPRSRYVHCEHQRLGEVTPCCEWRSWCFVLLRCHCRWKVPEPCYKEPLCSAMTGDTPAACACATLRSKSPLREPYAGNGIKSSFLLPLFSEQEKDTCRSTPKTCVSVRRADRQYWRHLLVSPSP